MTNKLEIAVFFIDFFQKRQFDDIHFVLFRDLIVLHYFYHLFIHLMSLGIIVNIQSSK